MLCFEVWVNGKKRYVAGHQRMHSIQTTVACRPNADQAHVFTSVSVRDEDDRFSDHRWNNIPLRKGDQVAIKITDSPPDEAADQVVRYGASYYENDRQVFTCSFCGRSDNEVSHMVTHPGANVCNDCIVTLHEILEQEKENKNKDQP